MQQTRRIFAILFLLIGRQLRALDRALSRSARRLLAADAQQSASRRPQPGALGAWTDGALNPPEHWLERVRAGAPWLLDQLPAAEEQAYAPARREQDGSVDRKARRDRSLPPRISNAIGKTLRAVQQVLRPRPARHAPSQTLPTSSPSRGVAPQHEPHGAGQRPTVSPHRLPVVPPRRLRDQDRASWPPLPDTTGAGEIASGPPVDTTGDPPHRTRTRQPTLQSSRSRRPSEPSTFRSSAEADQAPESASHRFPIPPRPAPAPHERPGPAVDWQARPDTQRWPRLPEPQSEDFEGWPVALRRWERLRRLDAEQRGEPWNAPPS